ncbi:hypothetical protein FEK35_03165 [Nocardia cyriacigeorgica]|uniref:Uncharacterized protein n=1 Tax=Nocardia cyriacigeorgica TaxID=135487 RepID=A0A5R8PMW0_9NOCA|nr:hypothetical protein [Nocardia cyriacigeorgica]TLG18112.1 hypothetical protein FEK35_03165 [Nocardia cyriacigeorgica]
MIQQQPVSPPIRTWDVVLGAVLYSIGACLGAVGAYLTLLFGMLSGNCNPGVCRDEFIWYGMLVSWVGTGVALLVVPVVMLILGLRGRVVWYLGLLSIVIVVVAFFGGYQIASQAV